MLCNNQITMTTKHSRSRQIKFTTYIINCPVVFKHPAWCYFSNYYICSM